jgi:DNA replication and repair protein RecF
LLQPEDIKLTLGAPADRRRFMDILLSQVSPVYLDNLKTYRRVLLQRNALLSTDDKKQISEQIEVWNNQLVDSGSAIIEKRLHFVSFMNQNLQSYYNNFSKQNEQIRSLYTSTVVGEHTQLSLKEIADLFRKKLSTLFKYEVEKQSTAIGPHRDDLTFYKNNRFFKEFGSQGENKSLIIALKILEWDYLSQRRTVQPILLFDDIFGELDSSRMTGLIQFLKEIGQAFITTTLEDKFSKQVMNKEIKLEQIVTAYA